MPPGKLVRVAVKVLEAHLVVDALVPALQNSPETLHAIGMNLILVAPDVALRGVMNGGVMIVGHIVVAGVAVRVDGGAADHVVADEALEDGLALPATPIHAVFYDPGARLVRGPVDHSDHHGLADKATPLFQLLVLVLVAFLPAEIALVHLDRTAHQVVTLEPALADAVQHEPRGPLGHADVPVEPDA